MNADDNKPQSVPIFFFSLFVFINAGYHPVTPILI